MFNFILGIAVGAAFAPFWMIVYAKIKARVAPAPTPDPVTPVVAPIVPTPGAPGTGGVVSVGP